MTIKELKKAYKEYLIKHHPELSKATIASYSAMAFLAYNKDIGFSLIDAMRSDKLFAEAKVKTADFLRSEHDGEKNKASEYTDSNIKKYVVSLNLLKEFFDYNKNNGTPIELDDYSIEEKFYDVAKDLYLGNLSIDSAVIRIMSIDNSYSKATCNMIFNAFLSMMKGEIFTRSLPYKMVDCFIRNISRDFGEQKRRNALISTLNMLNYYYDMTGQPLKEHRVICQKISDEFGDGVSFDYSKSTDKKTEPLVDSTNDNKNQITIIEAIVEVLKKSDTPLTAKEIYNLIVLAGLYSFGAKDPISVVETTLARACKDVDVTKKQKKLSFGCTKNGNGRRFYYLLSKEIECIKPSKESLIKKFEGWMCSQGYAIGTAKTYTSSILLAEEFAKSHSLKSVTLFSSDKNECYKTTKELISNNIFNSLNKEKRDRYVIAINKLLLSYGLEPIRRENNTLDKSPQIQENDDRKKAILLFESWMNEQGYSLGTISGYSGAIRKTEEYAKEHEHKYQELYTTSKDLCKKAVDELFSSNDFINYNLKHARRFSIAIKRLLECYGIESDLLDNNQQSHDISTHLNDITSTDNKSHFKTSFEEWLIGHGFTIGSAKCYSSAIITAEGFAVDHQFNHTVLYTNDTNECLETTKELINDSDFIAFNKNHSNRFIIAIKKLLQSLAIDLKIEDYSKKEAINYPPAPVDDDREKSITDFTNWMISNGKSEKSAHQYISALSSAETYASDNGIKPSKLLTLDHDLCLKAAIALFTRKKFRNHNEKSGRRLSIAIVALLRSIGIELDYRSGKATYRSTNTTVFELTSENRAVLIDFEKWLTSEGYSQKTIKKYIALTIEADSYSKEMDIKPKALLSFDEDLCLQTAKALFSNKQFCSLNAGHFGQYDIAITKLLKSYDIFFDYRHPNVRKDEFLENDEWIDQTLINDTFNEENPESIEESSDTIEESAHIEDKPSFTYKTIDFESIPNLAFSKPLSMRCFENEYQSIDSWKHLYVLLFKELANRYAYCFVSGMTFSKNNNGRIDFGGTKEAHNMKSPRKVLSVFGEDYFIETNLNAKDIVGKIKNLLDLCGIDYGCVSIIYVLEESSRMSEKNYEEDNIINAHQNNLVLKEDDLQELSLMDRIRKSFESEAIELIGDIQISDEEYEQLTYYFVEQYNSHFKHKRQLMVDPICATFLVQLSIRESDANYWSYVNEKFKDKSLGQNEFAYIGKSFIETLKQYKKPLYISDVNDYVKNIQFHGFVSNYRADNLFEFVYKYYDLDLDRDFEENQRDNNFDELISAIIKNDNTNRTNLIVQQTADALKKCESLGRKKILFILELIDRKYMGVKSHVDFDYEDARLKELFENWTHNKNSSFSKRTGESIEKRFRTPILKCNYQNNSFSILLPKQSIKVECFNENDVVNWKIIVGEAVIIEKTAEYKQSIIGISTYETEISLDSKYLFEKLCFELYLNDKLVKSFSPIKEDDYRFFDVQGDYGIHTDFDMLKEGDYYSFKSLDESSDSVICDDIIETVELGGLLRTAYSFVKGSTILLPNKRFHIVNQEKYSDGLVNKHLLDFISVSNNGNSIPIFSQFPSLIIGVDANKAKRTLISVNHQKFRMFDERVTTEEIGYHGNKVYYSVNLSELDRFSSGVYCVETDIGSGYSNKKWSFAYLKDLQIEFTNTPYIFKDKISFRTGNGFIVSGEGIEEKEGEYSFNLTLVDYPKKAELQLNNECYDIVLSPPVFKWEKDGGLTKDNLDYYWIDDIPKKIYYDMSGCQLDFQLDYGSDAAPVRSSEKYIETNSIKSYSDSNNGIQELYVVCDNRKYLLFKVVSKTIVRNINLSRDRLTDNLTVDIDILGNRKYYISVIKNGQTLLEKTPVLKGLNILEIEAETSEYLVNIYELPEDYDFGADYSLVDTQQIYYVNPSNLVGHKLTISGFINEEGRQVDLPKENNIFVKVQQQLDENSFLGKLYQTKEQYKHTHDGIGSISTRDFKSYHVLITIDNFSNLSLMKMLLQDEEYFLFDSKHEVFVDVEKDGLSFEKRIERYKELYEAKFIVKYEEE